ncbi:MAG: hypothetical protein Q8N83_12185 [Ignavibacteria bacterium]|nr:hypothetical protein [Ignavibacteria bacterium]
MELQIGKTIPIEYENTRIDKTRKPKTILSLADKLLLKLLLNNTSRMTGDCHVRFCERLKGETPFDLLGERILLHEALEEDTKFHEGKA